MSKTGTISLRIKQGKDIVDLQLVPKLKKRTTAQKRSKNYLVRRNQHKQVQKYRIRAFQAQLGICVHCFKEIFENVPNGHPQKSTADHFIRLREGGKATFGNITAACATCNNERD